jgi:hypothetical protein
MSNFIEGIGAIILMGLFFVAQFPGGTIIMALSCRSSRLDGWDWVLSVIIPFYGIFKATLSNYC